jgi:hypothetical protein
MHTEKFIKDLKQGDVVAAHGATFRVMHDAREAVHAYRPKAGHLIEAQGPNSCAHAEAEWVAGEVVPGYFGPGNNWVFQGNLLAGKMRLVTTTGAK